LVPWSSVDIRAKVYEDCPRGTPPSGGGLNARAVTKNTISHEDYKNTLFTGKEQMRTMKIIQSDRHEVYNVEVNKVALSSKDDKRHVLEDKIHTLAHEFYKCIVNGPEPRFSN